MNDELTERLRTALVKAGYADPRNGNPSVRSMAKSLELNNSRVSRYMYHGSKMQLEAREQIAEALDMTVAELDSEVQGRKVNTYSPPPAADLLDHRERTLVNDLINLLADRHERQVDHNVRDTSNMQAAGSAATEDEEFWPHGRPSGAEVSVEEIMSDPALAALEGVEGETPGEEDIYPTDK